MSLAMCATIIRVAAHFVNDPVIEAGQVVAVAVRDHAGEAFGWDPGRCSVADLMAWLGEQDEFVVVGGEVYRKQADGLLAPQRPLLERACVLVKWLAKPVEIVEPAFVTQRFAVAKWREDRLKPDTDDPSLDEIALLRSQLADAHAELVAAQGTIVDLRLEAEAAFTEVPAAPTKSKAGAKKAADA